jgi:ribonuclease P protein subunit POP4
MILINTKNIIRHELIGLRCVVVSSENRSQEGIRGKVIDETMKTIVIESGEKQKRIQKKGAVFRFDLGKQQVDVDGNYLVARPEDRIKKKFIKW